jgi:hypothetical protein
MDKIIYLSDTDRLRVFKQTIKDATNETILIRLVNSIDLINAKSRLEIVELIGSHANATIEVKKQIEYITNYYF